MKMLNKYGMDTCKTLKTPMNLGVHQLEDMGSPLANLKLYQGMMGSLEWAMNIQPNILFAVKNVSS